MGKWPLGICQKEKFGEGEHDEDDKSVNKEDRILKAVQSTLLSIQSREGEYLTVLERLRDREDSNKTHQLKDIDKIINEHESKRKDIRENVNKEI